MKINANIMIKKMYLLLAIFLGVGNLYSQIVLIGDNTPNAVVNDGDFNQIRRAPWREAIKPPFWDNIVVDSNTGRIGLDAGKMYGSTNGTIDSKVLNTNPAYQKPKAGDVLHWNFGADLEYNSDKPGTLTFSLVFGKYERILAEKIKIKGSDGIVEDFSGTYTLTTQDAKAGLPFIRLKFYSQRQIKVFVDYINIWVEDSKRKAPDALTATSLSPRKGIELKWQDSLAKKDDEFYVYRKAVDEANYKKIATTSQKTYIDEKILSGKKYNYIITRHSDFESGASNICTQSSDDTIAPDSPKNLETSVFETIVELNWDSVKVPDLAYYSVARGDANGKNFKEISTNVRGAKFIDVYAPKGEYNTYVVYAHDFSGNKSKPSDIANAKVKAVKGSSFGDLILPMPITNSLSSNLWGTKDVLPRDAENGIEDEKWSYWGGTPVYNHSDGKYHLLVVRWPEGGAKGHWEWPHSTVAHSVSDSPTGPYKVIREIAYDYKKGLGHNADIIKLQDGTYALYTLVNFVPTIFTSETMQGPWKYLGDMDIDWEEFDSDKRNGYQYRNNLSGVELENGNFLFVAKFGSMLLSENGILGPYKVITKNVKSNETIPSRYRNLNYEDPVMWRDEIQFHLLINGFIDKKAIYLRSPDGINWEYDPGLAYTPDMTFYENGVQNKWYKLERPHVLQDEYGRASHLSLAVIDVPKADDYANDKHSSKNLIIPLIKHKRVDILNDKMISSKTDKIYVKILAEDGFDPIKDVDVESLRFGSGNSVNYGEGSKALSAKLSGKDLVVEFAGKDSGLTKKDWVAKIIGKTKKGDLIVAYTKMSSKQKKTPLPKAK